MKILFEEDFCGLSRCLKTIDYLQVQFKILFTSLTRIFLENLNVKKTKA